MSRPGSKLPPREPGAEHLDRRSAMQKRIHNLGLKPSLLVVEDRTEDAQFIETPLRRLFGKDVRVTVAPTVAAMIKALSEHAYSVIVLDDHMDGDKKAEHVLPLIQKSPNKCPVILVSALLTRNRIAELHRLGAHEILAKDDVGSVALGEAILRLLAKE
jgi:CheY-like chemotaxis protein